MGDIIAWTISCVLFASSAFGIKAYEERSTHYLDAHTGPASPERCYAPSPFPFLRANAHGEGIVQGWPPTVKRKEGFRSEVVA